MVKIVENITELVGNSPIIKLKNGPENGAEIYLKLEYFNPGGSVKDRIALQMIRQAEADGRLKKGGTIVEPTSGNTGIGLAMAGAALGYNVVIIMPDSYSKERRQLIQAYGAELILTPAADGIKAAIDLGQKLVEENGWFMPMQFENPANLKAHELTTGPEIIEAFGENGLDAFVACAGTGGTISGVSHYLKSQNSKIKTFVVEPAESPILDTEAYDGVIDVTSDDALDTARKIGKSEGFLVGISSGAAIWAAYELAKKLSKGKKVLALCADNGERYLSTELYDY